MQFLLLGDQTVDQYEQLKKVCLQKSNVVAAKFLEQACLALRQEIATLPRTKRDLLPDFHTILNLVENYHASLVKIPELESSLLTISQLAHYIGYFEESPGSFPKLQNTHIIGLCSGLIAGAAISSARCLSELLPLAVEAVRISFRTGYRVGVARDLLSAKDLTSSWSTIVPGLDELDATTALKEFGTSFAYDASSQPYLSAISTAAVTISGPPVMLERFFQETQSMREKNKVSVPIYAPYHAQHLFNDFDIGNILDQQTSDLLEQFEPLALVHSTSSGRLHTTKNTLELFRLVLQEILRHPIRWDKIVDETCALGKWNRGATCKLTVLGVSNVSSSFQNALKAGGFATVTVTDHLAWPTNFSKTSSRTQHDKIAIVGMSGRFPNAADHEALWDLLMKGLDVHREIPKDRFDAQAHCDPSGKSKNKSHTPYGCFIDEPGLFDPRFFNMSPREAAQTDPMGRLALVTAYEALEMSGYVPNRTPSSKLHRIGTFYGQCCDDWREINAAENVDTYFITGGVRAFAAGRINYFFKFSGPSFSVDTACSSSLAAIQLACTSLWAGDCDTACAGGLNVLTNPDIFAGLSKGQFLSKTGSCKTYDNDADGYCRGDGCGTIILKRYEDAVMDKDNILGCILSTGTNHSAEAVSITHPHAGHQEFLYKQVLANAGVDAHDVTYVEMHGTGTQAGDGIEMTSVTNVFAPSNRQRRPDQPLYLGAIKANIGHGEAASGINSIIKVLLMMRENVIPPHCGIKGEINKSFPKDLDRRNVHIALKATEMPRRADKRKIFLNNFSAAGGNTAVLLEDGPLKIASGVTDPRSTHIVTVTARAISSLNRNINNLAAYLEQHPETDLSSLSYTSTARRLQHNYRISCTATNVVEARKNLLSQMKETYSPIAMAATVPAFVFTGQGSQYTGLGQTLYETLKSFKTDIDQLNGICRIQGLPSFLPILEGADIMTLSPVCVQLGMACIQVALARMWMSWGVKPCAVIGHSLGEYAALHVAGVISASDMIHLVGQRANILVQTCVQSTHGMLAVKGSETELMDILGENMTEIACRNAPEEIVLCGTIDQMTSAQTELSAKGVKSTMLKVPFAFHSAQVDPILNRFEEIASTVVFEKPSIPVLSPLLGEVIQEAGIIGPKYLAQHARHTMNFSRAFETGLNENIFSERTPWLEIGPHPVCSSFIKACTDGKAMAVSSLRRNEDPWKTLANTICVLFNSGVNINFDEYHREFNAAHTLLTLPTYSFDNKTYWLDYHNNWTLTKGEILSPRVKEVEKPSKLSTTSCQKIVFEELDANSGTVIVQSDLAEAQLSKAVSGHLVNDSPLCPSSLYADMALTVCDYLYKELRPESKPIGLNVCKMEVPKPLIAQIPPPPDGQHIQLEAKMDLEAGQANLKYRSITADGQLIHEHATCIVKIESLEDWQENWNMTKYMVQTQIDILKNKLSTGAAHKVLRGVAYKLFKALVNYDEKYRGMDEVILDGKETEATAQIRFKADESDGKFFCSPYWIDSLCHITGFICNGTDLIDSDTNVFISHGWGSMRFAKPFSKNSEYRSYVRMLPQPNNVRSGDVYIFEGDDLVGVVGGVKFQQIPRRVMDVMLPPLKARSLAAIKPGQALTVKTTTSVPKKTLSVPHKATPRRLKSVASKSVPARKSMVSRIMDIIATETDVNMTELVDEAAFDNLGVDSLMSLTISARFREELELEIPSSLFAERPTVGAMKAYFAQFDGAPPPATESDTETESDSAGSPNMASSDGTPPSSPPSISDVDEKPDLLSGKSPGVSEIGPSIARIIIAQEMGVGPFEISEKADLSELGMDSLMSLTVLSALREQTGQEFASTFLIANPTLEDIEHALGMRPEPEPTVRVTEKKPKMARSITKQLNSVSAKLQVSKRDVSKCPPATSVCLQGNPKLATKKLFLFPDGSGSATSYTTIPKLSPDVAVFGLNCPFMKKPADWTIGVDGVAQLYIQEIKRRQPKGPYCIGGWSAGGVMAYEGVVQLLAMGDEVESLILIDAVVPSMAKEQLPQGFHLFLDQIGLLGASGSGSAPDWLLPHFASAIQNLSEYDAQPLLPHQNIKTFAIWCRGGICPNPGDPRPPCNGPEPRPMKWLLDDRTDFGGNGWEELLGASNMKFGVMDGNHFTMMKDELAETLGSLIRQGLGIPTLV